jgi:hypothetical protein
VSTTLGEAPYDQHNKPPLVSRLWNGIVILQRFFQIFFLLAKKPYLGPGRHIVEVSRSHWDTPHSVALLWERDRPDADLYLKIHNTHKTPTPLAGFEPAITASQRPQTHACTDAAATGIGVYSEYSNKIRTTSLWYHVVLNSGSTLRSRFRCLV